MLFNKKSEIDDLFDFNGVKMKTFTQWNRLRHGPMERTEIMKNVTLKDVAKAAGVSYATVSRALSGSNQIGKSTRERIVRLCDEMGYTGNYVARSMVMKKRRICWDWWCRPLKMSSCPSWPIMWR